MASCHAARSVPTQPRIATAGEAGRQPSGSRTFLFTAEADQPRARRATDVILLLGSAIVLGLIGANGAAAAGCTASLRVVRSQYPVRPGRTVAAADRVVTLLGVIVLVGAIYRRRWYALRDLVLAGALAFALSLVVSAS